MGALVGQVPVEVNNSPIVSIVKFDAKANKQVQNKYGAYGFIGSAKGQEHGTWSASLAVPKTGPEVDWQTVDGDDGFTITYSEGAARYMLMFCHVTDDGLSNDPDGGQTDKTVNGSYGQRVRIS